MGAGPVEVMIVASELGRAGMRTPYAETMVAGTLLGTDTCSNPSATEAHSSCRRSMNPVARGRRRRSAWSPTGTVSPVRAPIPYADHAAYVVTTARGTDGTAIAVVDGPVGNTLDLGGATVRVLTADGADVARRAVNLATLALCAEALGAMDSALALTVDYLKTRKAVRRPARPLPDADAAGGGYVHLRRTRPQRRPVRRDDPRGRPRRQRDRLAAQGVDGQGRPACRAGRPSSCTAASASPRSMP